MDSSLSLEIFSFVGGRGFIRLRRSSRLRFRSLSLTSSYYEAILPLEHGYISYTSIPDYIKTWRNIKVINLFDHRYLNFVQIIRMNIKTN